MRALENTRTARGSVAKLALLSIVSLTTALGCGHPASEAECRVILRRAAELELRTTLRGSDQIVDGEVAALEQSMAPEMMKTCVGKRITDSALRCVRGAKTSEELLDECLR
jgi:hypothetical protein